MNIKFAENDLKEFIGHTLELWNVPGLAIAVMKDGQLVLSEGYGVRNAALALPVTAKTLFPIASCTKAFTAMTVGMLVDEGKLAWDKPIKAFLPNFQLWDPFATERLTVRDVLCHRSGLPGHDMMWYASDFRRREIFDRLRYLEPSCDLRCRFQYNNIMFIVAGVLVEEVSGMSWEQFVQTRIFDPLGMDHSNFSTVVTQQSLDFASPYWHYDHRLDEIPFREHDGENSATGPAGGICSCVEDMAKWLQFNLDEGKVGGVTLISAENLKQMHTPHIFVDDPLERRRYEGEFSSYGLGWGMRLHRGHFLLEHDGMADGFYSLVSMLPHANLGVVALSNCDAYYDPIERNLVPNIVTYTIYDWLLGLEPIDWNRKLKAIQDEMSKAAGTGQASPRAEYHPPSHSIEAYLGEYEHPGYGTLVIQKADGKLQMVFNHKLTLLLEHWQYDIFEAIFEMTNERQKIMFCPDWQGQIAQVAIGMVPNVKDILFTRKANELFPNGVAKT